MMAGVASICSLAVLSAVAYAATSAGPSSSGGPQPSTPSAPAPATGASAAESAAAAGTSQVFLAAGPVRGDVLYLRGRQASDVVKASLEPTPIVVERGRCPGAQVHLRSHETGRYLSAVAPGQVRWTPTADLPNACWAPVNQVACPGTSQTLESARYPGTRLGSSQPSPGGGDVNVTLEAPSSFVPTNPRFGFMCWAQKPAKASTI